MASLERHYISTGHLPAPEMVQSLVQDTHRRSKSNSDGKNSQAYPALARVPSELFGVCVVGTSGRIYGAGDVDYEFSIMSVSKPFLFALICETIGPEEAPAKFGANATGLPFNSLAKIESVAAEGNPGAGRSRQHHLRQQRPVAERDGEDDRHAPAGPGSTARKY